MVHHSFDEAILDLQNILQIKGMPMTKMARGFRDYYEPCSVDRCQKPEFEFFIMMLPSRVIFFSGLLNF
jgi:hypothetical protein